MNYTREWNLKWEHLSSSLQNDIYNIMGAIQDTSNLINRNVDSMVDINYNISRFYNMYTDLERALDNRIKELESIISNKTVVNESPDETYLGTVIDSGFKGEVLKMGNDSDTMVTSPLFYKIKASDNPEDKETMFENAKTLTAMFNDWYRFAHYDAKKAYEIDTENNIRSPNKYVFKDHALITIDSETIHGRCQNNNSFSTENIWTVRTTINDGSDTKTVSISDLLLDDSVKSRDSWEYHKDGEYLECGYKGFSVTGIMNSDDNYVGDFDIHLKIDSQGDNGNYGILLGYLRVLDKERDIDIEHTLSIVRSNGTNDDNSHNTSIYWSLVYDFGYRSQFILNPDINRQVNYSSDSVSTSPIVYLKAKKDGNKLICETSMFSDGTKEDMVDEWKIEFELPKKKPEGWPVEMYYNLQKMIPRSRVGFVSRANRTRFYVLSQTNVFIYDKMLVCFDEDAVYMNQSDTTYTQVGTLADYLEPRTYLFNESTNKFFYYEGENGYRQLT